MELLLRVANLVCGLTVFLSTHSIIGTAGQSLLLKGPKSGCQMLEQKIPVILSAQSASVSCPCPSDIAFYVRLSKNKRMHRYEDLKFDNIVTNQGSAYNKTLGHVVAPVQGLYQFSVSALSGGVNDASDMGFDVMKNGNIVGNIWCHNAGNLVLNLVLSKGDEVWIRKDFDSKTETVSGMWTSFSGHLIRQYA